HTAHNCKSSHLIVRPPLPHTLFEETVSVAVIIAAPNFDDAHQEHHLVLVNLPVSSITVVHAATLPVVERRNHDQLGSTAIMGRTGSPCALACPQGCGRQIGVLTPGAVANISCAGLSL